MVDPASDRRTEDTPRRPLAIRRGLRSVKLLAASGLVVGSLAVGGIASASASASAVGSSRAPLAGLTATSLSRHPADGHPLLRRLLRGAMHAEVVLRSKTGTTQTFVFDRGVVRAVTSTAVTIAPSDTPSAAVSATITSKTHFPGLPESQLKPGDKVALVVHDGDAVIVGSRPTNPAWSTPATPVPGSPTSNSSPAG